VVPLPGQRERRVARAATEFIRGDDAGDETFAGRKIQRIRHLAIHAEHGPSILPLDGHEIGNATHRAVIAKQVGIPIALRRIDQAALRHALVLQGNAAFIRAGDCVRAVDNHGAHAAPRPSDIEQVILAADLPHLGTFRRQADVGSGHPAGIRDDDLIHSTAFDTGNVRSQLDQPQVACPVDHVHAPVIVEEQRVVVQRGAKRVRGPRAILKVSGPIDVRVAGRAGERRRVERAVVTPQAAGPRTRAVGVLSIPKR
jgi:hypothetical protein